MPDSKDRRGARPFPPAVLALIALLGALIAGGVIWALPNAQDDLTARSQLALDAAGYDHVAVDFAGRDATVTGDVPTDVAIRDVAEVVYGLRGVRRVDTTRLTSAAPAGDGAEPTADTEAPSESTVAPSVTLDVGEETVTLEGALPSNDAVAAIVTAADQAFTGKTAIDAIVIDGNIEAPPWLAELDGIVRSLTGLLGGRVSISDDGVVVAGFAKDAAVAADIGAATRAATALTVSTDDVVGLGAPSFAAVAESGVVTLSGALPTATDVEAVVAAAESQFTTVNTTLTSGGVRVPSWLSALPGVFDATSAWRTWNIELGEGSGTFGGLAPSASELETLQPRLVGQLEIENLAFSAELEPELVAAELTQLLEGSATFQSGGAELSSEARALLDEVIVILVANPSTRLTVEGHTDDQGSAAGNLLLSQDRAQAVVDYLVEGGVAADRLTPVGYGEERPTADNGTNEGRQQNRRIEFVVESGGSG